MQPQSKNASKSTEQTFSILNRIGGDATFISLPSRSWWPFLSVSSIGSEAMQRPLGVRGIQARLPFSILNRIGGDATTQFALIDEAQEYTTFSILNRIGGDATKPVRVPPLPPFFFQYPQSDRRRCNSSSTSSWRALAYMPFSILNRIGGDATHQQSGVERGGSRLSVSSIGSEAMQQFKNRHSGV